MRAKKYYRMACEVLRVYAAFERKSARNARAGSGPRDRRHHQLSGDDSTCRGCCPRFHREHPGIEVRIWCEETTDQVERSVCSAAGWISPSCTRAGRDGLTGNPSLILKRWGAIRFIAAPHDERLRRAGRSAERAPHPELDPRCWAASRF